MARHGCAPRARAPDMAFMPHCSMCVGCLFYILNACCAVTCCLMQLYTYLYCVVSGTMFYSFDNDAAVTPSVRTRRAWHIVVKAVT